MTVEELNFNLFTKMTNEMQDFYEWLKVQPPEEIIRHSYEYAVKFDILSGMEEINLSESRARALLSLSNPLDDVYKSYDDQGLTLIDLMMETVENRADEIIEEHTANAKIEVYPHSEEHAEKNEEWESYQLSTHLNIQCKEAIESAIAQHYNNQQLDPEAIHQVVEKFGIARVRFVLVNTLLNNEGNNKFEPEYLAWAKSVPVFPDIGKDGANKRRAYTIQTHANLLNAYIKSLHQEHPIPNISLERKSIQEKLLVKPKKIRRNFRRISSNGQER